MNARGDTTIQPTEGDMKVRARIMAPKSDDVLRQSQDANARRLATDSVLKNQTFLDSVEAARLAAPAKQKDSIRITRRQARRWLRHKGAAWLAFQAERRKSSGGTKRD